MRRHGYLLLAWILLTCLAAPLGTAQAARKKQPPQPPAQTLPLTPEERWCSRVGELAAAIAVDRDRLTPLTLTLGRLRVILAAWLGEHAHGAAGIASMQALVDTAKLLYSRPDVPPSLARHWAEIGCLHPDTAAAPEATTPTMRPWR